MRLVIDIPEILYNYALGLPDKTTLSSYGVYPALTDIAFIVKDGIPLPKGHGVLIERDKVFAALHCATVGRALKNVCAIPEILDADKGDKE